jgi:hypothetical protein
VSGNGGDGSSVATADRFAALRLQLADESGAAGAEHLHLTTVGIDA